jgi:hypothetical protein
MILSQRWRFIFIKGRKVAGTSVEMALSTLCGRRDIVTPITPRDEITRTRAGGQCRNFAWNPADEAPILAAYARFAASGGDRYADLPGVRLDQSRYYNHMGLAELAARHGGSLGAYRVFAIERSPYSKVLSWANMEASYAEYEAGRPMRAAPEVVTDWIDRLIADGTLLQARNIDLYRDAGGRVAAEILRYAELPSCLHAFLAGLGAPAPPLPHAKKGLMADTIDPRTLLRPDQIAQVNAIFADEFESFGYPALPP